MPGRKLTRGIGNEKIIGIFTGKRDAGIARRRQEVIETFADEVAVVGGIDRSLEKVAVGVMKRDVEDRKTSMPKMLKPESSRMSESDTSARIMRRRARMSIVSRCARYSESRVRIRESRLVSDRLSD